MKSATGAFVCVYAILIAKKRMDGGQFLLLVYDKAVLANRVIETFNYDFVKINYLDFYPAKYVVCLISYANIFYAHVAKARYSVIAIITIMFPRVIKSKLLVISPK